MGLFKGSLRVVGSSFGVLLVGLSAASCSSSDDDKGGGGASADFGQLQKEYAHPSGTLSADDKAAIIDGLNNAQSSSGIQTMSKGLGKEPSGAGPHVLQATPFTCDTAGASSGTVTCTCNGGGSFEYSAQATQGSMNVTSLSKYKNCKYDLSGSTVELNGTLDYSIISDPPPPMTIYKVNLDETITPPGESVHLNASYAMIDGKISYSVQVGDGNVLIQATGSWDTTTETGTFTVLTKDGSTSCMLTDGKGSCTGAGGTVDFD